MAVLALDSLGTARPAQPKTAGPDAIPLTRVEAGLRGTVRFENVSKTYRSAGGEVFALDDVSLDIACGAIFGIIGRSGARGFCQAVQTSCRISVAATTISAPSSTAEKYSALAWP